MQGYSRKRRRAKRIGLVLCVTTLAVWELSIWCTCTYCTGDWSIGVGRGMTWCAWRHSGAAPWEGGLQLLWGLQSVERILPGFFDFRSGTALQVPFSVPFVLFAIPTLYVWWRDRRRRVSCLSRSMRLWKRVGTVACVVIVSAVAFGMHVVIGLERGLYSVDVVCGKIEVCYAYDEDEDPPYGWPRLRYSPLTFESAEDLWFWVKGSMFWPSWVSHAREWSLSIPLWMPLVAIMIPTAILWWRDRRPLPGYCPACGYDLRGTAGVRCSECGERIAGGPRCARASPKCRSSPVR